ncbi:PKD domain-containing protein [Natrinema salsiterrestre]|uniref:PKD domain-containing protein n=1 Tax=Natrinema salsiterrestre TaxID=2950540 RepID=A0A9Q4L0S0_9EURY|nr:PKD domain-containing protein [Natrinema salsiterrestre]MDF9747743.1 PKD domain-containing protein [Natrinema salsiterrestre]
MIAVLLCVSLVAPPAYGSTDAGPDADQFSQISDAELESNDDSNVSLAIQDLTAAEEIAAGETTAVEITVRNRGDEPLLTDLTVDGDAGLTCADPTTVSNVWPGETRQVTAECTASADANGSATVTVDTGDETATTDLTVTEESEGPTLNVSRLVLPDTAVPGESVTLEATLENTGDSGATRQPAIVGSDGIGCEPASDEITVRPGTDATIEATCSVSDDATPDEGLTVTVDTGDETATGTLTVASEPDGPYLAIEAVDTAETITAGETTAVEVTVRNRGTDPALTELAVDGDSKLTCADPTTITNIWPGETRRVTAECTALADADGSATVTVDTGDETATGTVEIGGTTPEASLGVESVTAPSTVERNESFTVELRIENTGNADATATPTVESDALECERRFDGVDLGPGENATLEAVCTGPQSDVNATLTVSAGDDTESETVTITGGADERGESYLTVTDIDEPASIDPGSTFTVVTTIENVGDGDGTERTTVGGEHIACERRGDEQTLAPGERTTVELTCTVEDVDTAPTLVANTADDELTTTIDLAGGDGGAETLGEPVFDLTVEDERTITMMAGPRNFEDGLTETLPETERADAVGVSIEAIDLELEERQSVSMRIEQRETLDYATAPESGVESYFEIAHTPLEDDAVENLTMTVSVDGDLIDEPDQFAFLRYESAGWNDLETTHLGTDERNGTERFAVESPGLSAFAAVTDRRSPEDARIDGIELTDTVDVQGNGRYNDFNLRARADTDVGPYATPFYEVSVDGERVAVQPVKRDRTHEQTIRIPLHSLVTGDSGERNVRVVLYEGDRYHGENASDEWTKLDEWSRTVDYEPAGETVTATEAARNTHNVSAEQYDIYTEEALNESHWRQCADGAADDIAVEVSDAIESKADSVTLGTLDAEQTGEKIAKGSAKELLARSGETGAKVAKQHTRIQNAESAIRMMALAMFIAVKGDQVSECYTVSLHLDDPDYNAEEYDRLHTNLEDLQENSRELESVDDPEREQALLDERVELLRETYALLPDYLEGTHASSVDEAVERSDLQAYEITSYFVEKLRLTLLEDYAATTTLSEREVEGNLTDEARLPAHGWTLQHTLGEELSEEVESDFEMSDVSTWSIDEALSAADSAITDVPSRLGTFIRRSLTGKEVFPEADEFGESRVYDTMDRYDDYTLYRVGFNDEVLEDESASLSIVRPTHENVAHNRFNVTLMDERPERVREPAESIVMDERPSEPDGYISQQFDFEPDQEDYYVLVEANGSTDHYRFIANADKSGTTADIVATDGPNVLRPEIRLEDGPERSDLRTGETVHASDDGTVSFSWHAWDAFHDPEELEYKYRLLDSDNVSEWSDWTAVDTDGTIDETYSLSEGYHAVQLVVRDGDGLTAVTDHTVMVDTTVPEIDVSAVGGANSSTVEISVDQRVDEVALEYRDANETGAEWRSWTTISNLDDRDTIEFNRNGHYELRGRATDFVGHTSDWDETPFVSRVTVVEHDSEDTSTSTSGGVSSSWGVSVGGGSGGGGSSGGSSGSISIGGSSASSASNVETAVEEIDGEMVMDVYVATREFPRVKVESIEFDETDSQEVDVPIPSDLEGTTEIVLEFRGEGNAQVRGINVTAADAPVEIESDGPVVVGESTELEAVIDDEVENQIESVEWDVTDDGSVDATGDTAAHTFTENGTHPVSVTITDVFGDSVTETSAVVAQTPPSVEINGTDRIDAGERASLVATGLDEERSIDRFEWDLTGDGEVDATGRSVSRSFTDVGEREIELRVTDERGATATATHRLAVDNTPPTADLRVRTADPMAGQPVSVSARRSDDEGAIVDYEWAVDGEPFDTGSETTETTFSTPGQYDVTVTVTDEHGATDAVTESIDVLEPVVVSMDGPSEALVGDEVTFETALESGSDVDYAWDLDGDGAYDDGENETATTTFDTAGPHTIYVLATDSAGTTGTASLEVDVTNPAGNASFSTDTDHPTVGEPITLELDRRPRANETYEWTIGGETYDGSSATHEFETPGRYDGTLVVSHEDGPTRDFTRTIEVIGDPEPTIAYDEPVVAGEPVQLDASGSGADSEIDRYEWDLTGDGEIDDEGETVTTTFETVGDSEVSLSVTDRAGRTETTTESIDVSEPVTVSITGPNETTIGTDATFDADLESGRDVELAWDLDGDGVYDDATGEQVTTGFDAEGSTTVAVTAESSDGVVDTASRELTVVDPVGPASFTVEPDRPLSNEAVSLELDREPRANETYQWTVDGVRYNGSSTMHTFDERGSYDVTLVVDHVEGTTEETTRRIDVASPPTAEIAVETPAVIGEPIALNATNESAPDGEIDRYEWDLTGDGEIDATGADVSMTVGESGTHEVTLQVTDNAGVSTNVTRSVTAYERPSVGISFDEPVSVADELALEAVADVPGDREIVDYEWSLEAGTVGADENATTAQFDEPGTHEIGLRVTDSAGVTNATTETVRVYDRPSVDVDVDEPAHVNRTIDLNATVATPENRTIAETAWQFGDGVIVENRSAERATIVVEEPGNYTVALAATDDLGATTVSETTIEAEYRTGDPIWWTTVDTGGNRTAPPGEDTEYNGTTLTAPTVVDDTVYAGSGIGNLTAVNATTGDTRWRSTQQRREGPILRPGATPIGDAPTVVGDTAYISRGPLRAVDSETGAERWSGPDDDFVPSVYGHTAANGAVYASAQFPAPMEVTTSARGANPRGSTIVAIDAESGETLWYSDPPETITEPLTAPTVANGTLYVADVDGEFYAVNATTGEQVWQTNWNTTTRLRGGGLSGPTVATVGSNETTVYLNTNLNGTDAVVALDGTTGEHRWENTDMGVTTGVPTVANDTVYVSSENGTHAIDATTGQIDWTVPDGASVTYSPTVANGTVYATGDDGTVYALDAETGERRWRTGDGPDAPRLPDGEFATSPIVVDGTLYVGDADDRLFALATDTDDGWSDGSRVESGTGNHHDSLSERAGIDESIGSAAIDIDPEHVVHGEPIDFELPREPRANETYEWRIGDRRYTGPSATHTFENDGGYSYENVELTVVHDDDRVPINIAERGVRIHEPPTAAIGHEPPHSISDGEIEFTGTGSVADYPLDIESYEWDLTGDGEFDATGETVSATFDEPGTHEITLRVTDSGNVTNETTETVRVYDRPTAVIDHEQPHSIADDDVALSAADSSVDRGLAIDSYEWDLTGDGEFNATGETVSPSFDEPGTHEITLRVTDTIGFADETTESVRVYDRPSVDLAVGDAYVNRTIDLNATVSTPENRTMAETAWQFDDGVIVENRSAERSTVVVEEPGNYTVALEATDDLGATAVAETTIDADYRPGDPIWATTVENGSNVTSPTVVDDTVYTESKTGTVTAVNATTGDTRWRSPAESPGNSSEIRDPSTTGIAPTIVDDTAFISSGTVRAVDKGSGDERWENDGEFLPWTGKEPWAIEDPRPREGPRPASVQSTTEEVAPEIYGHTTANGAVYVSVRYPVDREEPTRDGPLEGPKIVALDAENGNVLWPSYPMGDTATLTTPTVANESLYVGDTEGNVYAMNATNGQRRWQTSWATEVELTASAAPTVATIGSEENATLYLNAALDGSDAVVALDANTGRHRWSNSVGHTEGMPTVVDDTVYVSGENGTHAIDAATGRTDWSVSNGATTEHSPTVANGTVYTTGDDGTVSALDAETGAVHWQTGDGPDAPRLPDGEFATSPIVVDGTLYVGDRTGELFAIATDGTGHRSTGSRVEGGTENHHDSWEKRAGIDDSVGPATIDYETDEVTTGDSVTLELGREPRANETYEWRIGERRYTGPSVTHTFNGTSYENDRGYERILLTVIHDNDRVPYDMQGMGIAVYDRPTAAIDHEPPHSIADDDVALSAADSSVDRRLETESVEWDLTGDGEFNTTGESVSTSFDEPGDHEIALRVTDSRNVSSETTETVRLYDRPTVDLEVTDPASVNRTIDLNATVATPENRTVAETAWQFDDGVIVENRSAERATIVVEEPGNYSVGLEATDDLGATTVAETTIHADDSSE